MPSHLIKSPFQFIDSDGNPVVGGSVETYEPNASSTPKPLYSDKELNNSAGSVHSLNALGMFDAELFGDGDYYMIVKYENETQAYDMEYIEGEGSGNNAASEWVSSVSPTFISTTSFSVPGDLTSEFHSNRRVRTQNTGGTVYSTIVSSSFSSSITTVTVVNDSGVLDSGLSSVELGFLRGDNYSVPEISIVQAESSNPVNKIIATSADTGTSPVLSATGDNTNINISLEGKGDGYVTASGGGAGERQGIYVGLDEPELLVPTATATGAWLPYNAANNTLKQAGAKMAFLSFRLELTGSGPGTVKGFCRTTGTTPVTAAVERVSSAIDESGDDDPSINCFPVNLNSDNEFDYRWLASGSAAYANEIYLLGFWV